MKRLVSWILALFLLPTLAKGQPMIASFQPGGSPSFQSENFAGLSVSAFGVSGGNMAFYGGLNNGAGVGLAFGPTNGQLTETDFLSPTGVYGVQGDAYQAMTFDASGRPVVTYTEMASASTGNSAVVVSYNQGTGSFQQQVISGNVGPPRYSAVAVNGQGGFAVYSGSSVPQTIVSTANGTETHSMPYSNFPGPLAYDAQGNLYQAIVNEAGQGRDLHFIERNSAGTWTDSIIQSNNGFYMTGHIDLALTPAGNPVIIGDSAGDGTNDRTLSVTQLTSTGWKTLGISLDSIFGSGQVSASNEKELVFDSFGNAYVAILSNEGPTSEVAYMEFNSNWAVIDARTFPADNFYGMGVDNSGTVYLAYDSSGDGSGGGVGGTVPEPSSLVAWAGLAAMGLIACAWQRRRRKTA